ncbi:fibronectin type III domain-containing protein, partial [bacterium]|nr:fibronectin type III domain-containing protein [bacterium]
PLYRISDQQVRVMNPEDPIPVTGIAVEEDNGGFTVKWNKPDDDRVEGYTILYTTLDDLGHFDEQIAVTDPDKTTYKVTGLENGQPVLLTVVAVNESGDRSLITEVVRVVPEDPDGTTSPEIISVPGTDAEAGSLYVYAPQYANSERFVLADHQLVSTLVVAPDGMEIDEVGDVVWTPTVDQIGDHEVQIQHKFIFTDSGETNVEMENFTIHVVEEGRLVGEETQSEILSQPDVSAFEKSLYSYQVEAYDPDGVPTYRLAEGPDGMTIDASGLVTWYVPDFTSAFFPVRIEVTFANGETEDQEFILDVVTAENTIQQSSVRKPIWNQMK